MTTLYFYSFLLLVAGTLLRVMWKPKLIFEFPYFMAAVFAVFIVPQTISLRQFPGVASEEAVQSVLLMCCLCMGMCLLGYLIPANRRVVALASHSTFHTGRFFVGGIVFVVVGYFFSHLIGGMSDEETGGSNWTGVVTIYLFFSNLIFPGFAVSLITALRLRKQVIPWIVAAIASIPPLESIILAGRREVATQIVLTVILSMYYFRRYVPPRLAILGAIVFAMLAIPATGIYRSIAITNSWEVLPQLSLVENFKVFVNSESNLELRNGAVLIDATKKTGSYEFGSGYWDEMVFRFVPAQLVGTSVKNSLMFDPGSEHLFDSLAKDANYAMAAGTTLTGMGDSFQQFGYLGCLFFAVMGVLFRNLYAASLRPEAVFAQLLYIQIGTSAMRTVTHQTVDFLPGVVYNVVFLGLLMLFAGLPAQARRPGQTTKPLFKPAIPARTP